MTTASFNGDARLSRHFTDVPTSCEEILMTVHTSKGLNSNTFVDFKQTRVDSSQSTEEEGGSEWRYWQPVRKENVVALQRAEMRMVRWMCGIKLNDRFPSKELRERLGMDDMALVLQQNRLHWYGHVLRKEDDDWVKKCIEYEVESPRPRGRPKRTWREVVKEDWQARKLNTEDAMDRSKWRNLIKDVR